MTRNVESVATGPKGSEAKAPPGEKGRKSTAARDACYDRDAPLFFLRSLTLGGQGNEHMPVLTKNKLILENKNNSYRMEISMAP